MLYGQGECHPIGENYTYKLFLDLHIWNIQVYHKNIMLDQKTFRMGFEPICGMDVTDSNIVDNFIIKVIQKNIKRRKKWIFI